MTKLLPNFHWSSESNVNFKAVLNTPACLNKLTDFMNRNFKLSSNGIEEANKQLTEILLTAGKMSLNQNNKNPSNSELREKSNEALKLYKTFCNRKRKQFWTKKVNYLYDVNPNTTNMWNAWKSCNEEFQPRSPPLEDGDIWKNYYQHLFENETDKHDSSSTPRLNKNIKLNTHKLSESESVKLNMQFSIKELKKFWKN